MTTRQKFTVKDAANALVDLNTFATVVTILEGGSLYCWKSQKAANRIIRICQAEQQKRLDEYDAAAAAVNISRRQT